MKKAQGLSLNTIIIAALVIIVLIVLVVIFSGRINIFRGGLSECSGTCVSSPNGCSSGDIGIYVNGCVSQGGTENQGNYCCPSG